MVRQFFTFVKGRSFGSLGAGTSALAYRKPQTDPINDGFNVPGYAVEGSLAPQSVAYVKENHQVARASYIGNGIASQGQLELQRLAQLMKG